MSEDNDIDVPDGVKLLTKELTIQEQPNKPTKEPSKLQAAIREELISLIDGDLTEAKAGRLSKVSTAAATLLKLVGAPRIPEVSELKRKGSIYNIGQYTTAGAIPPSDDEEDFGSSIAVSSPAETFGARAIKELVASLPMILGSQQQTPYALVDALTLARQNGMTDVARELENKLVGKALDGDRPVLPAADKPLDNESKPAKPVVVSNSAEKAAKFLAGMAIGASVADEEGNR